MARANVLALVMAGGAGTRMRESLGSVPKPLVPVRGVALLERNLLALLGAGFGTITVAVPAAAPEIGDFVMTRGRALASALGASIGTLEEQRPLGSIGCAAALRQPADAVLIVFADNLSAIDLEALLDDHLGNDAALTVAIHHETFRLPYGEVAVRDGRVVAYREKPEWSVLVSSGTYVLGSFALAAVPRNTRLDVWRLVQLLLERGATVRPFHDGAPWVDVNDAAALQRAEALVAAHPERLDCWFPAPDATVEKVLLHGPDGVLVELRPDGAWDLPGAELVRGRPLTIFDDVDVGSRRVIRHHIRVAEPDQARIATRRETPVAWLPVEDSRLTLATRRALAALGCGS